MRIDLHELEKVHRPPNAQQGGSSPKKQQDGTDVPLRIGRWLYVHGVVSSRGNRDSKPSRIWSVCERQQVWYSSGVFREGDKAHGEAGGQLRQSWTVLPQTS